MPDQTTGMVAISFKDALAALRECEEYLKGQTDGNIDPMSAIREFLSQGDVSKTP